MGSRGLGFRMTFSFLWDLEQGGLFMDTGQELEAPVAQRPRFVIAIRKTITLQGALVEDHACGRATG